MKKNKNSSKNKNMKIEEFLTKNIQQIEEKFTNFIDF